MKYAALLIDPPWNFTTYSNKGKDRSPEKHYPTMGLDALKSLNVAALMADDCAVFMWVTWPTLPDAMELGRAWGLTYKTCAFCWAKTNRKTMGSFALLSEESNWFLGLGYWTRANTEPCLLFTKGSPKRKGKGVRQLVVSAIQRHSQKPDCIYNRIESLVDGPYLELFARQRVPGWAAWGNEVPSDVEIGVTV